MKWELAILAAALLLVAGISRRLIATSVTPQMVFMVLGILAGSLVIGAVTESPTGGTVRTLAEATLTLVLFGDAARIKLPTLERERSVPLRLLGIGLPLTIALGALFAALVFAHLTVLEAVVIAIVLAPTDAALGQAVVTEPRLPTRIRQGLNVESGLNDGICLPLLLIALALAETEAGSSHVGIRVVLEELGYGALGGAAAGLLGARVVTIAGRHGLITGSWLQVIPIASAALAYGLAAPIGGSGFIAAFVAGAVFGGLLGDESEAASRLGEELSEMLGGITFLVFGAVLLGPALGHMSWQIVLYALLSLTIIRMLPVAVSMLGTGARLPTVAFLGWFGPRGLASIVFALLVVEDAHLPGTQTILLTTYATIGLSVFAHGITAAPMASRYADWYGRQQDQAPKMESLPVAERRLRGRLHLTS